MIPLLSGKIFCAFTLSVAVMVFYTARRHPLSPSSYLAKMWRAQRLQSWGGHLWATLEHGAEQASSGWDGRQSIDSVCEQGCGVDTQNTPDSDTTSAALFVRMLPELGQFYFRGTIDSCNVTSLYGTEEATEKYQQVSPQVKGELEGAIFLGVWLSCSYLPATEQLHPSFPQLNGHLNVKAQKHTG